jgi:hypothetical protein
MCIKTHACSPDKKPDVQKTYPVFVKQFEDFVVANWIRNYEGKYVGKLIVSFIYEAAE